MDCLQAVKVFNLIRRCDTSNLTQLDRQSAVDHVHNCGCDSCRQLQQSSSGPQPAVSLAFA